MLTMLRTNYEARWILAALVLVFLGIAVLINKITGGVIFSYLARVRSKDTSNFLLGFQWIFSALLALVLPNNFLDNIPFFQQLYTENEIWIPVSMVILLYTSLLIIGYIFGLFFNKSK